MTSSQNSEYQASQKKSQMMSHHSQVETSGFGQLNFKKRNLDYSQDNIEKSNVFNNNRLSVTRILNNSQQI